MNHQALARPLLLISGFVLTGVSFADQQNGSLNAAASAQVNWSISCEPEGNVPSARLAFQIEGLTKGRKFTLKAEAQKDGLSASTIDFKPADKKPSAFAYDVAGDGVYRVNISKIVTVGPQTAAKLRGTMLYSLTAHCESQSGLHTRTTIRRG